MLNRIVTWFSRTNPKLREFFYTHWYQFLARTYTRQDWKFMNYGFAPTEGDEQNLSLDSEDEVNRYYIQLYHQVTSQIDLTGLSVLEVGSGRGGGAEYIKNYLQPSDVVGVDLSENVIELCKTIYDIEGLSFKVGNAEALPFRESSFDVVVNVESSHCYGSVAAFLNEVKRVLRDDGYLLLADFRRREAVTVFKENLNSSGLTLIQEKDITPNILRALDLDHDNKAAFIKDTVHKPLTEFFDQFAGGRDSKIAKRFISGETVYLCFLLQKTSRFRTAVPRAI